MIVSDDAFRAATILIAAYGKADTQAAVNRAHLIERHMSNSAFARQVTEAMVILTSTGSTDHAFDARPASR